MINRLPRVKLSGGNYWSIDDDTIALFDGSFDNQVSGSSITIVNDANVTIDGDGAFVFNGSNAKFEIDLVSNISTNYTIEFLINGDSTGSTPEVFMGHGGAYGSRFDHFFTPDVSASGIGVGGYLSTVYDYPAYDTWFVFAVDVYSGSSYHYGDGLPKATFTARPMDDNFPLGWDGETGSRYFKGKIKSIRISDVARYQGGYFTPPSWGTIYTPPDFSGKALVAGASMGNGVYDEDGTHNSKTMWSKPGDEPPMTADWEIKYDGSSKWQIWGDPYWMGSNEVIFEVSSTADTPPETGWTAHSNWSSETPPSSVTIL